MTTPEEIEEIAQAVLRAIADAAAESSGPEHGMRKHRGKLPDWRVPVLPEGERHPGPGGSIDWDEVSKQVHDILRPPTMGDLYEFGDALLEALGAPPMPRGAGGRPPKAFLVRLAGYGAGWLAANGSPNNQADLERALHKECERREWSYSESQIREMAAEMLAGFHDALK
jgi:hypothetical protein